MSDKRFQIIRGDDVSLDITFTDQNGDPVDLTDTTVFFTVKRKLSETDEEAIITKEITSHTNPTNGETNVSLSKEDTDQKLGDYFWDLQLIDEDGKITSSKFGQLQIVPDVTLREDELS